MNANTAAPFSLITPDRITAEDAALPRPLWGEFLASGLVSLCTSRWKSGKTTLLSILLARMGIGGELAGRAVPAGKAVVVSEEAAAIWADRHRRLNLGSHVQLCCRPFRSRPTPEQWHALIEQIAAGSPDLVVIDPLAMVLPGAVENHPTALLDVLEPLHLLTEAGAAVLILHHPKKAGPKAELSPRGSGALSGFADILLTLDRIPGATLSDRRRRLGTTSRLYAPTQITLQLNAEGTDYTHLTDAAEPDGYEAGWPVLKLILEAMVERVTRHRLRAEWLEDHEKPSEATLRRWLQRAEREGLVDRTGTGRRRGGDDCGEPKKAQGIGIRALSEASAAACWK
ncbi:hypothetical protein BH11PLA2_BH11PLA2_32220 [soil metagenome]